MVFKNPKIPLWTAHASAKIEDLNPFAGVRLHLCVLFFPFSAVSPGVTFFCVFREMFMIKHRYIFWVRGGI